jgi:hypothetical protein
VASAKRIIRSPCAFAAKSATPAESAAQIAIAQPRAGPFRGFIEVGRQGHIAILSAGILLEWLLGENHPPDSEHRKNQEKVSS